MDKKLATLASAKWSVAYTIAHCFQIFWTSELFFKFQYLPGAMNPEQKEDSVYVYMKEKTELWSTSNFLFYYTA